MNRNGYRRTFPVVLTIMLAGLLCWCVEVYNTATLHSQVQAKLKKYGASSQSRNVAPKFVRDHFPGAIVRQFDRIVGIRDYMSLAKEAGAPLSTEALRMLLQLRTVVDLHCAASTIDSDQLRSLADIQTIENLTIRVTADADRAALHTRPLKNLKDAHLRGVVTAYSTKWLSESPGLEAVKLEGVGIDDRAVADLMGLDLKGVRLIRTSITDSTLQLLSRQQALEFVEIAGCPHVSCRGARMLSVLPKLRWLALDDNPQFDSSILEAVSQSPCLKFISSDGTSIDPDAYLRLGRERPDIQCYTWQERLAELRQIEANAK